ncbi:MAG: sigma-70 family RNA polymerase sigma factor [Oscillospiraceae bacterium]|jgi:RNA polymerase sigma-70 factor (ECF subfamily)|nr:sigma-70 family RNA polymerase sigma factor [Oscillospiraceae bacterium]
MDDDAIVDLFWRRSEDALTECQTRFGAYCRAIARRILNDEHDADECVNDALLRAWNAIPPARPNRLGAFLGKITRNLALDRYDLAHAEKRGGGAVEIALDELGELAAITADEGEITRVINVFLRKEPPENADIFVKRYWQLRDIRDVAAEYGCSESKITSLLFRMRARLKKMLDSEGLM